MTRLAMAPDADGDVLLGDLSAHIGRIHNGQWLPEISLSLFSASPDPNGGAWFASHDRVRREVNGRFTDIKFPQSFLPHPQPLRIASDNLGALWVSGSFGVLVLRGDKWTTVGLPPGFPGKTPTLVYADIAGRVWLGFKENAIMLIDGNAQRVLSEKDGLDVGAILAVSVRGASTWISGSNGLQFFDGKRFRDITPPEGGSLGIISGAAETSDGSLWLNAYRGIIHLAPPQVSRLKAGENREEYTLFETHDGLPGPTQQDQPYPSLIQATDGKLWFATSAGPVWIDPNDIPHNALPRPVAIRSVTATENDTHRSLIRTCRS
jgi:ligand-binding sensor domain-containing protein